MNTVDEVLAELYARARRWQEAHGIQFQLTLEQYETKWSPYRRNVLAKKLARGQRSLSSYLADPTNKPVLGWTDREAKASGIMHDGNCLIEKASQQLFRFQIKQGERHTEATLAKMRKPKTEKHRANMRKPKSDEQKAKMSASAKARHARARVSV